MFRTTFSVILSLALAGQAGADQTQYARSAGVEPGVYSNAAITAMRRIAEEGPRDGGAMQLKRLRVGQTGATFSAKNAPSPGRLALARAARETSPAFSSHDLHQIVRAQEDRNEMRVRLIEARVTEHRVAPSATPSPGQVQVARSVGVDPALHTIAELIGLRRVAED